MNRRCAIVQSPRSAFLSVCRSVIFNVDNEIPGRVNMVFNLLTVLFTCIFIILYVITCIYFLFSAHNSENYKYSPEANEHKSLMHLHAHALHFSKRMFERFFSPALLTGNSHCNMNKLR